MWLTQKIKASAIQYVLVVSILIAIIVFAFISLIYLQQKLEIKNNFYEQAIHNVQNGFYHLQQNNIAYDKKEELQFSDNPSEITSVLKQHWGIFDIGFVTSTIKNETFEKVALLGHHNPNRETLYLQENNKPLVLVGDTKITGNVLLPRQGVKRGSIAGTSYNGERLIYGNQKFSNTKLPAIKNLEYLKKLINKEFLNDSLEFFQLQEGLQKVQTYKQPLAVYQSNENISLRNISLKGKIIIQSNTLIKVTPTAKLKDIILIAPRIEVSKNVIGSFQAIATKEINIAKNCKLEYPSALTLIDKNKITNNPNQQNNRIFIDENSEIKGSITYYNEEKDIQANFSSQVFLSKNSIITGEVYCNQNLELQGSIYGSVYTNSFITKQFGSIYVNYIYNGVINNTKLPEQYCGLFLKENSLKVAKWLY